MRLVLLLPLLAAGPAAARADDGLRVGNPQPAVALGIGAVSVLSTTASGGGVHLEALARVLPETLLGLEGDALMVATSDPDARAVPGRALRGGVRLRHSIMGWGPLSFGGELAAVVGGGWERIEWNRGGQLHRSYFTAGIEDGLVVNRGGRYGGLSVGARFLYSRGPAGSEGGMMLDVTVRASP
jgi:hypothetical protein